MVTVLTLIAVVWFTLAFAFVLALCASARRHCPSENEQHFTAVDGTVRHRAERAGLKARSVRFGNSGSTEAPFLHRIVREEQIRTVS